MFPDLIPSFKSEESREDNLSKEVYGIADYDNDDDDLSSNDLDDGKQTILIPLQINDNKVLKTHLQLPFTYIALHF